MSTLTAAPMNLVTARRRAERIVEWLLPYCERIQVAGSIRRERPLCNDIDLVCIPKTELRDRKVDMFTTEKHRVNLLREFLCQYVNKQEPYRGNAVIGANTACWKGRNGQPGPEPKEDASNLLLITAAGVQLDVWCATPETWFTRLLCRTGSMQHNIWAAERAKALRGHWSPYESLRIFGEAKPLTCEEDFYAALGMPCVKPQDRERDFLSRLTPIRTQAQEEP